MKEYVIWGVPKDATEETLLLTSVQGEKITDRKTAERLKQLLETKYGATETRIQEIDLGKPLDWMKETGLKRRN